MGTFRLPVVPRPKMTVCVLGTEAHVSEAKALELGALVRGLWEACPLCEALDPAFSRSPAERGRLEKAEQEQEACEEAGEEVRRVPCLWCAY